MARSRALAASAFAVALTAPRAARAELHWRAPDECPAAADVRARVDRRLAGDAIVDASIDVVRADAGFAATIATREDGGPRTLFAAGCDELADAVAVIVARDAIEVPARAPVPVPPRVRRWHAGVRVAAIAGVRVVPNVGVAGEVAAFARVGRASVELGAARWLASGSDVDRGTVQHLDAHLTAATARLGAGFVSVPLRGWVVGELGTMVVATTGMDGRRDGGGRWIAIGAGFGATWRAAPAIAIVTAAEVIDALARPSFQLVSGTPVYAPPRVSARGWIGVELAW